MKAHRKKASALLEAREDTSCKVAIGQVLHLTEDGEVSRGFWGNYVARLEKVMQYFISFDTRLKCSSPKRFG